MCLLVILRNCFAFDRKNLTTVIQEARAGEKYLWISLFCRILFSQVAYIYAVNATNSGTATIMQSLGMPGRFNFILCGWQRGFVVEDSWYCFWLIGTYLLVTGGNPGTLILPTNLSLRGVMCAFAQAALSILPKSLMEKWGKLTVNGLAFCSQARSLPCLSALEPYASAGHLVFAGSYWCAGGNLLNIQPLYLQGR